MAIYPLLLCPYTLMPRYDLRVDGRIILKYIFKKWEGAWT
jgi:hypothetical protein